MGPNTGYYNLTTAANCINKRMYHDLNINNEISEINKLFLNGGSL